MMALASKLNRHWRIGTSAAGLVVALAVALADVAHADSRQTALIDGRVVDAAGAALVGVTVRLVGDRGEQVKVTDVDGRFLFASLAAGDYVAAVGLTGSASTERAVRLETGDRRTLDFHLDLETEERIDVIASAPLVDPHQPGVVSTIDGEVIGELVFANRNYQAVLAILPGVAHRATSLSELTPHVNGNLWQESSVFIDGVDVTDSRFGGGSRMPLPASAFAEVRTVASGYGSEYGRAVGGVTETVTRSGTNQFHGDLLYVAQNPSWRAASDVVPLEREDRLISSYETSLGGPIARDRAWFFAAAGDTNTNTVAPLAGGEAIDSSLEAESIIGKLDVDASARHHVSVTGIDGLSGSPLFMASTAERAAVANAERGTTFVTAAWSWTAANDRIVEVRGARQRSSSDREAVAFTTIESGASPDDPAGNNGAYWDNASGLHWHGSDLPLGPGSLEFPRDQANAALTWLLNRHELEGGADWQEIGWEALNRPPPRYFGSGYDPSAVRGLRPPGVQTGLHSGRVPGGNAIDPCRGVRSGSRRPRRTLGVQPGLTPRGPGPRGRPRPGGDRLDRSRAARCDGLRRRRQGEAPDQGHRRPLRHPDSARLPQPGVLQSAQRRQRIRRVSLEPGDAALRSLQPPPAPRSARRRRGRRALPQGRADRRDRLAVDPGVGARCPCDRMAYRGALERHQPVR